VFALPVVKLFGLHAGALITNFLLNALGLVVFARFLRQTYHERVGMLSAWILAFYPGTAYWGNLPYPQTMIIPVTLIGFVLLYRVNAEERLSRVLLYAGLLGLVMLAYDLVTYFGPVLVGLLFLKRKWLSIPPAAVAILLPSILLMLFQQHINEINPVNVNTEIYGKIIGAYLNPEDIPTWIYFLKISPLVLVHNFFACSFFLLPLAFAAALLYMALKRRCLITRVEVLFLMAGLALWAFSNLAPPYTYWYREMRGYWLARVFVPITVPLIIVVARSLSAWWDDGGRMNAVSQGVGAVLIIGQAVISFGGIMGSPVADRPYYEFYRHSKQPVYSENIERFGRHPVGFAPVKPEQKEAQP
jgi:hypothetical protein